MPPVARMPQRTVLGEDMMIEAVDYVQARKTSACGRCECVLFEWSGSTNVMTQLPKSGNGAPCNPTFASQRQQPVPKKAKQMRGAQRDNGEPV
jgi:hypothetical protein